MRAANSVEDEREVSGPEEENVSPFGNSQEEESDSEEEVNPFASFEQEEETYDEGMFSADVDCENSETLQRIFDGGVEDAEYQSLPESGSALMHHDLANYFQGGIYSKAVDEALSSFDTEAHFGDRGEVDELEVDVEPWGQDGDVSYSKSDLERAYAELKEEDPTSEEAMEVLEPAANDENIPQFAREVVQRSAEVGKAAKAYDKLRGSEAPNDITEVEDAIWAFDEFTGINLEIGPDVSRDQQVVGNEALKFAPSTLVQNAYEAEVLGDTDVYVERNDSGDIQITYESSVEGCGDIGDEIFEYDIRDDGGLGFSVSSYVIEKFGGEMNYEGDEENFRVSYTLQTPE